MNDIIEKDKKITLDEKVVAVLELEKVRKDPNKQVREVSKNKFKTFDRLQG